MIKESLLRRKIPLLLVLALTFGVLGGLADYFGPAVRVDENALHPPAHAQPETTGAPAPAVSAAGAVLIRADTGAILFEKEAEKRLYPASTTKIMTALVVLETLDRLSLGPDSRIIVPAEAAGLEGSSVYLKAGEEISMEELLYGMMLHSGNDAALALAISLCGSEQAFVRQMNCRAEKLGLTGTHFANPHGLDSGENYATALDLARLAQAALRNALFREVVSTKTITCAGRTLTNHNKLLWRYDGCIGVKTGYTKHAGRILVSAASLPEWSIMP